MGNDNVKELLLKQKNISTELENEIHKVLSCNFIEENKELKAELSSCRQQLEVSDAKIIQLAIENQNLKNSLYEQMYNEKLAILNASSKRINAYYNSNITGELNRLSLFELQSKQRIKCINDTLIHNRIDLQDEIYEKINELENLLNLKITMMKTQLEEETKKYAKVQQETYQKLHEEGVSESEMKRALKKNNIESLIGLNILNKVGILFLIFGLIALSQFTYLSLPDVYKGILIFITGAVILIVGECLNRKNPNVFSLGLTSGGVAVLYIAIAICYFRLQIIPMYLALFLCIGATGMAFALSQRYQSQAIATFALVGGYLPILSIAGNELLVYSAMAYFIILNTLSLMFAFRKKWPIAALIGFSLNVLGTMYMIALTLSDVRTDNITTINVMGIIYIIFTFLIYTLIPILSTYYNKKKMATLDIILLGSNTYISTVFLYIAFITIGLSDFKGLLTLTFAVVYFTAARFIRRNIPQEKYIKDLFYIISYVFIVLTIPMQFGIVWLSLGWLIEGVCLVAYGIYNENKKFLRYGYTVCGFCLAAFLIFDVTSYIIGYKEYFTYKYLSITMGSIVIMCGYLYKRQLKSKLFCRVKYFTYINLWSFLMYMIGSVLSDNLYDVIRGSDYNFHYIIEALCITVGLLLAYVTPRFKALTDNVMKYISFSIYGISILRLFVLNSHSSPVQNTGALQQTTIIGSISLIIINLLSILALMDLLKYLVIEKRVWVEWRPMCISIYSLTILTQNLINQYHLSFTNLVISVCYIILAFSWIVFGFIKRYSFIRRLGLGLSILSIAKLFIIDLSFLSSGYRIVSYFSFGFTMIAISFVYQHFNKRLEIEI